MTQTCTLTLNREDVSQILDAVRERLNVWRHTAAYLRNEPGQLDTPVLADCDNAFEADTVVQHYKDIIAAIEHQAS
jgi:hypothetical protein